MALIFESIYSDIIALTATVFIAVYWWISSKYSYWSSRGVPGPKPEFPFGNVKDWILKRSFDGKTYQKIYNALDGQRFGGMYFLLKPTILLRDPELIKTVMVKEFAHFHDRNTENTGSKTNPLQQNLVSLTGESWKGLRHKLTPTFTSGKMKAMSRSMVECAHNMTNNMSSLVDSEGCVEVKEMSARFTTDVVGSCVFGLKSDAITNPDSEFRRMGLKFTAPSWRIFVSMVLLKGLPKFLQKIFNASKSNETYEFFLKLIQDTVKQREENNIVTNDFLQLLLDIRNKEQAEKAANPNNWSSTVNDFEFDDKMVAVQCIVFFVAGFETSSTTMSFCLYELALNPEVQDKLRHEIDSALKQHNGQFTYDALQDMKYLDYVVDETLRKHPPATTLRRRCTKPYIIPGTKVIIEEGVDVHIPIYSLHHDPKYYPEPEKFQPERFNEENKSKRPQFTHLPFGDGPRMCIGMRFGLLQAKIGLAALISKFVFTPCSKTKIPLELELNTFVTTAKGGLWLQATPRK